MRKFISASFLVVSTLFLIGCSDDSVTPSNSSGYNINGNIENWYYGTGKLICFVRIYDTTVTTLTLDTSEISTTGDFQISFASIPDSMLIRFAVSDSFCTHHTVINPSNSKYSFLEMRAVKDSLFMGNVVRSNDTIAEPHSGKCYANYYFFDRSTTVQGTDTCNYYGYIVIADYNMSIGAGLNTVYTFYNEWTQNFIRATVSTAMPVPVKWYLEGFSWDNKFGKKLKHF